MQALTFNQEITQLKKDIKVNGWNKKLQGRMALEYLFHISVMVSGFVGYWMFDNWFLKIAAMLISSVGAVGITTHTHSSSHHTTFKSRTLNDFFVYFGYTFQYGTSANYWWNKHIVVHHPNTNIYEVDDDIDLKPVFAFTKEEMANTQNKFKKFLYSIQWFTFPLALALNGFNIQSTGWRYLLPILFGKNKAKRTAAHWLDLFVLIAHWIFWLAIPSFFFPFTDVLAFHCIRIAFLGYGMYMMFAPAHFPEESVVLDKSHIESDFYLVQLLTTVNFRTKAFGRMLSCGLDYQIEHHLFPGVTPTYYPLVGERLKEICARHGYPYRTLGWGESLWKGYLTMVKPRDIIYKNIDDAVADTMNFPRPALVHSNMSDVEK